MTFRCRPKISGNLAALLPCQPKFSPVILAWPPARSCDFALIHALEADQQGNAQIGRHWGSTASWL
jgi:hypothetical protein